MPSVTAMIATALTAIAQVSALRTGDIWHPSLVGQLPDLEEVCWVVDLAGAVDHPVLARRSDRAPHRVLGGGAFRDVSGIVGLDEVVVAGFDSRSACARPLELPAERRIPPTALHEAELARIDVGVQVVVQDVRRLGID